MAQEIEVVPLTFNVKFERALCQRVSAFLGAGLGVAFVDYSGFSGLTGDISGNDEVFAAQAFGGIVYHATSSLEVFAGLRWIHLDDEPDSLADIASPLSLESDGLVEFGLRYNF